MLSHISDSKRNCPDERRAFGAAGVMEIPLRSTPATGEPLGEDRADAYEPLIMTAKYYERRE